MILTQCCDSEHLSSFERIRIKQWTKDYSVTSSNPISQYASHVKYCLLFNVTFAQFYFSNLIADVWHICWSSTGLKWRMWLLQLTQCRTPLVACLFISQSAVCEENRFKLMSHWSAENSPVCHWVGLQDWGWRDRGESGETHIQISYCRHHYQCSLGGDTTDMRRSLLTRFTRATECIGLDAQRSECDF